MYPDHHGDGKKRMITSIRMIKLVKVWILKEEKDLEEFLI